jgi:hypothetical protein
LLANSLKRASRIDSPKWLTKIVSITALKHFATFTHSGCYLAHCHLLSRHKDPSLIQIV